MDKGFESKAIAKVAKMILDYEKGSKGINMRDGFMDYNEAAATEEAEHFFTKIITAFALLDQMAPEFIQFVDEYHIGENMRDTDCHLCKLREAAQEYLDERP